MKNFIVKAFTVYGFHCFVQRMTLDNLEYTYQRMNTIIKEATHKETNTKAEDDNSIGFEIPDED